MKRNFSSTASLIIFATLFIFMLALHVTNSKAEENRGFKAKRKAFCRLMLRHGADAYARGQFEKAGYYFSQAVNADPTTMAKSWYELRGIKSGKAGLKDNTPVPVTKPEASSKPVPKPEKEQSSPVVIMGDDEGC